MSNPYVLFVDDTIEQLKNHSNRVITLKVDKPSYIHTLEYQIEQKNLLKKELSKRKNRIAHIFHDLNKDFHFQYSLNNCLSICDMKRIINYSKKGKLKYVFFDWDFTLSRLNGFYRSSTINRTLDVLTVLYQIELMKYDSLRKNVRKSNQKSLNSLIEDIRLMNQPAYIVIEKLLHTKCIQQIIAESEVHITLDNYLEFIFGPKERISVMKKMFRTFLKNNINYYVLTYNGNSKTSNGKYFFSELLNHLLGGHYFTSKQIIDGYYGKNFHKSRTINILLEQFNADEYMRTSNIKKSRLERERRLLYNSSVCIRKNKTRKSARKHKLIFRKC